MQRGGEQSCAREGGNDALTGGNALVNLKEICACGFKFIEFSLLMCSLIIIISVAHDFKS